MEKNKESNLFYIYFFDKERLEGILKSGKPPQFNYKPYLMAEPLENKDAFSFKCHLLETAPFGLDYVQYDFYEHYPQEEGWRYVDPKALPSRTYYEDFCEKKGGAFTFNGVTYFKLIDVRVSPVKEVEFHLRQITNLTLHKSNTAFMIMPFHNNNLNVFYETQIKGFLKKELNMDIARADDFTDNDVIIETIYAEIERAEIVICEITECNKNVFFEIGYAKGINKQMIFIAQRDKELKFFDVNHIRGIEYDLNDSVRFQERLKDTIQTIRAKQLL